MFFVYILQSERDGRLYIGQTNNITERLWRHNSGQVIATKFHRPWKIIYQKIFQSRAEAMRYERYLKSLKNKEYILKKIIIAG
jgi:putative endonuclease